MENPLLKPLLLYVIQLSNEKNPGWLGYIGDEVLPSYIGIILRHYKGPH